MPRPASTAKPALPPAKKSAAAKIIRGARAHFLAHGFRGVTMDDLAAELGMSKKTLYAHFASKSALLEAAIADKLVSVDADLKSALGTDAADFSSRLEAMLQCMRRHMDELQPPFIRDVRREAPELFARVQDGRRRLIQRHFGKLLKDGGESGSIRRDIPGDLMIEILIAAVDAVIRPARLAESGLTPRTGFAHIISVFLEGALVRPRGKK